MAPADLQVTRPQPVPVPDKSGPGRDMARSAVASGPTVESTLAQLKLVAKVNSKNKLAREDLPKSLRFMHQLLFRRMSAYFRPTFWPSFMPTSRSIGELAVSHCASLPVKGK